MGERDGRGSDPPPATSNVDGAGGPRFQGARDARRPDAGPLESDVGAPAVQVPKWKLDAARLLAALTALMGLVLVGLGLWYIVLDAPIAVRQRGVYYAGGGVFMVFVALWSYDFLIDHWTDG